MNIDDEVKDIMGVWHSIEEDTKWELANIWLDKEKHSLKVMEAEIEDIDDKAYKILRIIRDSKGAIAEMHEHKKHLLSLIHHVKPTREWQREIQEDLDKIIQIIKKGREDAKEILRARMEARREAPTQRDRIGGKILSSGIASSDLITIPLVTRKKFGDELTEARIGTAYGKPGGNRLLLKRIEIKGNVSKDLAFAIFEMLRVLNAVKEALTQIRYLMDKLELDIEIDYGESWPRTGLITDANMQYSAMLAVDTFNYIFPNVQLNTNKFEIDINSRPVKIIVKATHTINKNNKE